MKNGNSNKTNTDTAMFDNTAFSACQTENTQSRREYANMTFKGTAFAVSFVIFLSVAVNIIEVKAVDIISSAIRLINNDGKACKDIRNKANA